MIELGLTQPPRRPEIREGFTDAVIARLVALSAGVATGARWRLLSRPAAGGASGLPRLPSHPPASL